MGTLDAATTDLRGKLTITSPVRQLTLGNLTGPETLNVARGSPPAGTPMSLTLGQVTNASLLSGIGIQNVTVMADRYGKSDMPERGDSRRNAFEVLGDVLLFLKTRSVDAMDLDSSGQDLDQAAS